MLADMMNRLRHTAPLLRIACIAATAASTVACTGQQQGSPLRSLPDRTFKFADGTEFRGSLTLTARDGKLYSHLRFVNTRSPRNPAHFEQYFQVLKNSIGDTKESLTIRLIGARGARLKQQVSVPAADMQNSATLVAASSITPITNDDYARAASWQVAWLKMLAPAGLSGGKYVENPKLK